MEISAEVVADTCLQTCQAVEDLEIPETLKDIVIEKVVSTFNIFCVGPYILQFRFMTFAGRYLTGSLNTEEIRSRSKKEME